MNCRSVTATIRISVYCKIKLASFDTMYSANNTHIYVRVIEYGASKQDENCRPTSLINEGDVMLSKTFTTSSIESWQVKAGDVGKVRRLVEQQRQQQQQKAGGRDHVSSGTY